MTFLLYGEGMFYGETNVTTGSLVAPFQTNAFQYIILKQFLGGRQKNKQTSVFLYAFRSHGITSFRLHDAFLCHVELLHGKTSVFLVWNLLKLTL